METILSHKPGCPEQPNFGEVSFYVPEIGNAVGRKLPGASVQTNNITDAMSPSLKTVNSAPTASG